MSRTTIHSSSGSFTAVSPEPRSEDHETASEMVHLHFQTRFCSQTRVVEGGREEEGSTETPSVHLQRLFTSSVVANRSSLQTREEIAEHVRQHFSGLEYECLLGWVDHVAGEICRLIQSGDGRPVLSPNEFLMVLSTTTVTHCLDVVEEFWEDVDGDLEGSAGDATDGLVAEYLEAISLTETDDLDELAAAGDSQFAYEPVTVPASKASVDALLRKKVEEDGWNSCVVCQDEVGRGDSMIKMPCCHEFHEDCILPWLQRAHSCPLCRLELPTG